MSPFTAFSTVIEAVGLGETAVSVVEPQKLRSAIQRTPSVLPEE